jgi:iron(III) transport system substrate-binding protein
MARVEGQLGFRALLAGCLAAALATAGCGKPTGPAAETGSAETGAVNVYSGRHYDSDLDLYATFTRETGIKVNLIEAGGDALIERLAQEGEASPADVFITADAGVLWRAESRGLLRPVTDQSIIERAPRQYRHPEGMWVGLSKRARVIIYNKDAGLPPGLENYEDLAKPEFRGMICIRSSSNVYNQSLLASIIAHHGVDFAEEWARGVVANFARKPQGADTTQIEGVAAGICRLGVVNSYYVARYLDEANPQNFAIGEKIGVLFPNQETTGTHVNISGAGVAAHAPNGANAEKLIAFLLRDSAQGDFARGNNEYPVVETIPAEGPITRLGAFRADTLDVAELGERQADAIKIFDRVGWP